MKLKLNETIKNLEGEPLKGSDGKEMTLSMVCTNALLTPLDDDKNLAGDKKATLFTLAMSIHGGQEDITVEEATMIKERIGRMYSQLVVGRAYELIEE